jgi:hypothetical protein
MRGLAAAVRGDNCPGRGMVATGIENDYVDPPGLVETWLGPTAMKAGTGEACSVNVERFREELRDDNARID